MVYVGCSSILVVVALSMSAALLGSVCVTSAAPLAQQAGLDTLTHKDLANIPKDNRTYFFPRPRNSDIQCKSLRSKMQISDGFCTSIKPVKSVLCTGSCLPEGDIPWYAEVMKLWSRSKTVEHRCEDDVVRRKKVELVCENGETRKIQVKVVKSCKCTRYIAEQNRAYSQPSTLDTSAPIEDIDNTDNIRDHRRKKHKRRRKGNGKRRKDRNKKKDRTRDKKPDVNRTPSEL